MLITILVTLQFNGGNAGILPGKVTVEITNNLSDYQLGVHCKDKNHDLGFQVLPIGGSYNFKVSPNLFLNNTLYFCNFNWITEAHWFNIYDQERDDCDDTCHWDIVATGPCKVKEDSLDCFHWNNAIKAA
ncbi:Plant self-incompatibility protein S1 [Sesbania bispinosa]|nr:Plant self-incompatibility protein S1 [Sesbania bispinosa]